MDRKLMKIPRRNAVITFSGTEYDGIEIVCVLDVPLRTFFDLQRMGTDDPEQAYREFGDRVLKEWNAEGEDGEPVPANGDGFLEMPREFASLVLSKWVEAVAQPAPLSHSESPSSDT